MVAAIAYRATNVGAVGPGRAATARPPTGRLRWRRAVLNCTCTPPRPAKAKERARPTNRWSDEPHPALDRSPPTTIRSPLAVDAGAEPTTAQPRHSAHAGLRLAPRRRRRIAQVAGTIFLVQTYTSSSGLLLLVLYACCFYYVESYG